jgi:hypothetical protein
MSLKDNLAKVAGKAKVVAEKSGDKIASGVDKATDKIDKKTGGKYHDKLEKVDNLASKLDKTKEADAGAAAADADAPEAAAPTESTPEAGGDVPPMGTMPS